VHLTLAFSDLRIDPKYRDCTTGDSSESRTQEQSERELPGGWDFCREDRRTGSQRPQLDKWRLPRLSIEMVLSKSNEAPRSELILATYLGPQRQVFVVGVVRRMGGKALQAKSASFSSLSCVELSLEVGEWMQIAPFARAKCGSYTSKVCTKSAFKHQKGSCGIHFAVCDKPLLLFLTVAAVVEVPPTPPHPYPPTLLPRVIKSICN
jgi:hypothetical protein